MLIRNSSDVVSNATRSSLGLFSFDADPFLIVIFSYILLHSSFPVAFRKLLSLIFSGPSSWRRCSRQLGFDGENGTRRPPTFVRSGIGGDPSFSGCRHRSRRIMF